MRRSPSGVPPSTRTIRRRKSRGIRGDASRLSRMTTKLQQPFKRELDLKGEKYTITISPEGFKLVQKGKRKGIELTWASIVGGEAALATALNASTLGAGARHPQRGMTH